MNEEEDDMLELLDDEELIAEAAQDQASQHTKESTDDSLDDELELDETEEEEEPAIEEIEQEHAREPEPVPEKEGLEVDIRYLIVAAVAIAAILVAAIFFVLPTFSDKAPDVTINPSQTGEDLFLYHAGGAPLNEEFLTIQINGAPASSDKFMLMGGGAWPWSLGTVLRVDTSGYTKPAVVTLLYKPKSTEYTVYTTTVQPVSTPTPEPMITPDQQAPTQSSTPVSPPAASEQPASPEVTLQPVPQTLVQTQVPVVAPVTAGGVSMDVQPASGAAPLTIQCNDLSTGCIRNRVWNFGDGITTMKRSPSHVYPFPGTYNISLDVRFCDPEDSPAVPPTRQVVVSPSLRQDTIIQGTGKAQVSADAKIFFTVKGPGTNIRIGGRDHYLNLGDHVELLLGSGGNGDLSVVSNAILKCDYSNVTMIVNGEEVENGTISVININQYLQFETADITIKAVAGRDGAKGLVGGQPMVNAAPGQQIIFSNVGLDSYGKLLFSVQNSAGFTFRGGVGSYEVSTISTQ
ncbi:MAG TPA: PKD domain-containing protein [Methanospirillum sp.]|uniref:PKD domain-containing protein n=1 Tax=Methanospirillum sp. TaxID=45200 RepID=UPI002C29F313|nr:PKD domain-containing protein [Methanospirillum sp.]HWQ63044.1 PKD domain-containing protein [Methanospirillum sp.]